MTWLPELTRWDALLVVAVSAQATVLSYMHSPRLKAFVFMLPIPFTTALLAVGGPLTSEHAAGLVLLFGFLLAVWALRVKCNVPIVASIAIAAVAYCAVATLVRPVLPAGRAGYWWTSLVVAVVAAAGWLLMPPREEPGHRTSLPVWIKLPCLAAVIVAIILLKGRLGGFMVMFPFMGTIAAYEARHSLWTLTRQVPVLMAMFLPMMAAVLLTEDRIGLGWALALGWAVYLAMLVPYWWFVFGRRREGQG